MNDTVQPAAQPGSQSGAQAAQGIQNINYNTAAQPGQAGSLDPTIAPPVSQTSDAAQINNQISGNTQGVVFPQAPGSPTNGVSSNASIPAPIPTAADVLSQGTASTPAEQTNTTLLQKIAALMGSKTSQGTMTNQAEQAAGVPGLQSTFDELNSQIQGLADQSTLLQQAAASGGAIQNNAELNAAGRGVGSNGLASWTGEDLKKNQLQQATIASQSLTLKAALYGAQNKLSLAKDSADKAATAQYEQQQNQIDYQNALIAANLPSMNKQEKAQAALVTQNLQDRQTQIDNAKQDKTTIVGLAVAAMKNNPSDPAAQYAAQQALAESNKQQPDLQAALKLVGQYQTDPNATAKAVADLANTRADTAYKLSQAGKNNNTGGANNITVNNPDGTTSSVPSDVAPYVSQSHSGIQYADLSTVQGTAAEKKSIVDQAQAAGIKVITNKNTALDLTNIGDANSKLDSIATIMTGIDQPSALSRDLGGLGLTKLASMAQSNPQQAAAGALQGVGLDILKAISGVQGFRGNTSVVQQITDHLPSIYDTNATVQTKVQYIRQLISDRENAILGQAGSNVSVNEPKSTTKGTTWNRSDGTYISDGTQWVKQK